MYVATNKTSSQIIRQIHHKKTTLGMSFLNYSLEVSLLIPTRKKGRRADAVVTARFEFVGGKENVTICQGFT